MVTECAIRLQPTVEKIREKIEQASVAHFDETGLNVYKTNFWTHSASTTDLTYLSLQAKRGFEGMEASRVLPNFKGIAVHDCWLAYWKYTNIIHAVCCAHLLRELTGIIENAPTQIWAKEMIDLLLRMKEVRDKAVNMDKEKLSYYHLNSFHKDYLRILEAGRNMNPILEKKKGKRGRHGKGKTRSLIERFFNYKESICLFTKNFSVPFDNNLAERDIRMIKVKMKVSGCFRTTEGAESFLTIMSYLGTAKKNGIRPMLALQKVFSGDSDFIFSS
jgi:transposase